MERRSPENTGMLLAALQTILTSLAAARLTRLMHSELFRPASLQHACFANRLSDLSSVNANNDLVNSMRALRRCSTLYTNDHDLVVMS